MAKRRGLTQLQVITIIALVFIIGALAFKGLAPLPIEEQGPNDENTTGTTTDEQSTDESPPGSQEYRVTDIIIDDPLVPSGVPVYITALFEKVSGEDPFPVTLSISGTPYVEMNVTFGESNFTEAHFTVTLTRQGKYEAHVNGYREEFEVRVMPVEVEWISVSPRNVEPNREFTVTFGARNINNISVIDELFIEVMPDAFVFPVDLPPMGGETFNFTLSREHPGDYNLTIAGYRTNFTIMDTQQYTPEEEEFVWTPIEWEPDPATWNMTSMLPPEASPIRLRLPVPIESLYDQRWAGIGGMGLHAGGHIEGLDHVWIESTSTEPVKSWANGTVEWIQLSGDIEHGEYHIGINYGSNLYGIHMEVETPLVEVGDYIMAGDPVGYGQSFSEGLQSAELSLIDYGRTDGIYAGNGVYVSPFDYLIESERIALAEAYITHVIQPYMESGAENGMFDPAQPYFTNRLLIHREEDRLQGEWYLISQNWTTGYPNDMITIIEADNKYYTGAKILGMDDESMGGVDSWNFNSELTIDYEARRISWISWAGKKLYGIFSIDESEERARLTIQYQTGAYPIEFTEDALVYVERSYVSRRMDGAMLGVLPE